MVSLSDAPPKEVGPSAKAQAKLSQQLIHCPFERRDRSFERNPAPALGPDLDRLLSNSVNGNIQS